MINSSEIFADKIKDYSRNFKCRIKVDGEEMDCDIKSVKIIKGMMGDSVKFGTMFIPSLEMELMELSSSLLGNRIAVEFGLFLGMNEDGSKNYEYIQVGMFYIVEQSVCDGVSKLMGVGALSYKLNGLYVSNISYPATVLEIAEEIRMLTGVHVVFGDEINTSATFENKPQGLKYNEVISYIAGLVGANATEDKEGNVTIRRIASGEEFEFSGDYCLDAASFNGDYVLGGIKIASVYEDKNTNDDLIREESFVYGDVIKMEYVNPYMTETNFDLFKASVVGLCFNPGEVSLSLGDPRIEPWDVICFADRNDNIYRIPCLNTEIVFDGALKTVITAPGSEQLENGNNITGSVTELVERTHIKMQSMENLIADKANVNQLNVVDAKIEELQALSAQLERLKTEVANIKKAYIDRLGVVEGTIDNLEANKMNTNVAEISEAWIKDLMVRGNILTSNIYGEDAKFSHTLSAVNIIGDNITAGTISAKRLVFVGEDDSEGDGLLFALNKYTNELEATIVDEGEIKRLTLDGKIITADSINAEQINVKDLFSQNIEVSGDFAMGTNGALKYDSAMDTLQIKADVITVEGKNVATEEDLDQYKTSIEKTREHILMVAQKNAQNEEKLKTLKAKVGVLADGINMAVKTMDDVNATFDFTTEGLVIGRSDSAIKSIQDNKSYKFKDNQDNVLLNVDTSGIDTSSMSVDKQVSYFSKWATRKGRFVEGIGHNLNDVWIGG